MKRIIIVTALLLAPLTVLNAAEWQWSVPVTAVQSAETGESPRAFLWIPPNCARVRGVVIGQHNMEEEPILEHPTFRAALSELGFAEIWVTPGWDLFFRFDKGAGEHFNAMMKAFAHASGYDELETVPVVPLGHSAAASYPWNFAAWNPARTVCVLSVSGQWPFYKDQNTPDWGDRKIDGVPGLVCMGEYEDAAGRAGEGLKQRAAHPMLPLSMLQEPGAGHFDVTDDKVAYIALYLKKAARYRLGPIDPRKTGWLVDRWRRAEARQAPAAPVMQYSGHTQEAFWYFDEELARATEAFKADQNTKKAQLVGYVQDGQVAPQNPKLHAQVNLKFLPVGDGLTFKLTGMFLDTVPEGRPEGWTGLPKGASLTHATSGGPVIINRICGPVEKQSDDTFAIRFYRMGMNNTKRSNEIWLTATHPGNSEYKRAVQQAVLHFPLRNTEGKDQHIKLPEIQSDLKLNATADSGLPVHYYVREGPAEIAGHTLRLTTVPPRAKFPVQVTVVAWQWGRGTEPKIRTAESVQQTFQIHAP